MNLHYDSAQHFGLMYPEVTKNYIMMSQMSANGRNCQNEIYNLLLTPNTPTTTVQSSTSRRRSEPGGTLLSCASVIRHEAAALLNAAFMMALAGVTMPPAAASAATRAATSLVSSSQIPSVAKMTNALGAACKCKLLVLGFAVMYLQNVTMKARQTTASEATHGGVKGPGRTRVGTHSLPRHSLPFFK
jgi:hypothetical protein